MPRSVGLKEIGEALAMKSAPARNGCKLKFFAVSAFLLISRASCQHDYVDALNKALMFLEAQRQGVLPSNQRITWRGDSALSDGRSVGVSGSILKDPVNSNQARSET